MGMFTGIAAEVGGAFGAIAPEVALLRLALAIALGGLVGLERELHANAAGLRTHILISLASCLFALIAFEIVHLAQADPAVQTTDTLRLIEAVTSGVAFLAAGSIIVSGGRIQGLTTGAGMWLAGAIGLCCGIGRPGLAVLATGLALIVLWLLKRLADRMLAGAPGDRPESPPGGEGGRDG